MTELRAFLASLYDSLSEAELQALRHGQVRLAELLAEGGAPEDVSVPVYHASDVEVTLDVGLRAEETETGTEMYVTEADPDDASSLVFTVELFDLVERGDLEDLDYEDILGDDSGPPTVAENSSAGPTRTPDEDVSRDESGGEDQRDGAEDGADGDESEGGDEDGDGDSSVTIPPVSVIDDLRPRHRERLEAAGVARLTDLAERSPEDIAEVVGDDDVSVDRAAAWRDEARGLSAVLAERGADLPVELVDGIGPTYGSRLRERGVDDLSALLERSPETIAEMASTETSTVSADRAREWVEEARVTVQALGEREEATAAETATDTGTGTDHDTGAGTDHDTGTTEDEG